jgi:tetratricopeptide (TPR) repeat protein
MKRSLFSLLGLLFTVLAGVAQQNMNQGLAYLDDLQFHKARSFFLSQVKASPGDVRSTCSLGDTYLYLQLTDSAKLMYDKALTLDPKSAFPIIGLGKVALIKGDKTAELELFERARKADKKNPEVYYEIAQGCFAFEKKDTATGHRFLTIGIELNSKFARFHIASGDYEAIGHRYGAATNAYERAIFFDPNSALAYRKLGVLQTMARANRDAINSLAKSIELNSDQILVYKNLGDLYYSIGRFPEAEKNYIIYMERAEVSYDDKERFAIILFFNKKYDEAAKLLEDVMKQNADESILLRIRGYIAYETKDYAKGVEFMAKFFKLHDPEKNIASDYLYYGRLLQKNGNDTLAIQNYIMALAADSTKTEIYDDLAKLYATNRMHNEAANAYLKMIANGSDKVNTWFLIGKEYYFQSEIFKSQYDTLMALQTNKKVPFTDSVAVMSNRRLYLQKADSAFMKVTELNPEYAGGFMWRGRMNSALDPEAETTVAKEIYEKALAIFDAGDQTKMRKSVIECYKYLGSYYFLISERILKSDKKQSEVLKQTSIEYWKKILLIDPADPQALEVFDKLKIPLPVNK